MRAPLVLVPPSEGKSPGGRGRPWTETEHRFATLDPRRTEVIAALASAMRGPLAARRKLLGVGADAAAEATRTNLAVDSAPTMRAVDRFTGVLYDALDVRTMSTLQRRRLARQVVIFSGLWGALAPNDPIPDHKLKMGASLGPLGRLSTWWRPAVSAEVNRIAAGRVVWNLLPHEHDAAWRPDGPRLVVKVRFLDEIERKGTRRLVIVSHWNKLLKAALVRHVLAHQTVSPDELADFRHPEGYQLRPDLSSLVDEGTAEAVLVKPLR